MLHCLACDKQVSPWEEYCEECKEAISEVYTTDSKYASFLKGIHPEKLPHDFFSVDRMWELNESMTEDLAKETTDGI